MKELDYKFYALYEIYNDQQYSLLLQIVAKGAISDCPASLYILGLMYLYGDGVPEDRKLAGDLIRKAESIDSRYNCEILEKEEEQLENKTEALKEEASYGYASTLFEEYYHYILMPANEYKKWELRSALSHDAPDQVKQDLIHHLFSDGAAYFSNQVDILRKSKSKIALLLLGAMHMEGNPTYPDTSAALRSLERAAKGDTEEDGIPQAHLYLMGLYANGILVELNTKLAMEHANKLDDCLNNLDDKEKKLWEGLNRKLYAMHSDIDAFPIDHANTLKCLNRLSIPREEKLTLADELYSDYLISGFYNELEDLHLTFAMGGSASAMLRIGLKYFIDLEQELENNEVIALQMIRLAALLGNTDAARWEKRLIKTLEPGEAPAYLTHPIPDWFHEFTDDNHFRY